MAKIIKNNGADASQETSTATPLWETIVMAGSFFLLWAWFGAHQAAQKAHQNIALGWHLVLGASLIALVIIMVRRMKRVKIALDEGHRMARGMHGMPFMPPDDAMKRKR